MCCSIIYKFVNWARILFALITYDIPLSYSFKYIVWDFIFGNATSIKLVFMLFNYMLKTRMRITFFNPNNFSIRISSY